MTKSSPPSLSSATTPMLQEADLGGLTGHYNLRPKTRPRRLLIVGKGNMGQSLAREIENNLPDRYTVVGFVTGNCAGEAHELSPTSRDLGGIEDIAHLIHSHSIDEVIVADCLEQSKASLSGVASPKIAPVTPKASRLWSAAKRAADIMLSLAALIILAPVAAVIALAVRLTSAGPIIYNQERVGLDGRIFTIYKFRTLQEKAETHTGPTLTFGDQQQVTSIGKALRATHLDECPQFYNVLRGDMSIVGPRPERPCFVDPYAEHIANYSNRHTVRPGITGLAQVYGGYLSHPYVKLHYDLTYARCQSFLLDFWILLMTPFSIVTSLFSMKKEMQEATANPVVIRAPEGQGAEI